MEAATTVDWYNVSREFSSLRDRVTNIAEHLPVPMNLGDVQMYRGAYIGTRADYTVTEEDDAHAPQIVASALPAGRGVMVHTCFQHPVDRCLREKMDFR